MPRARAPWGEAGLSISRTLHSAPGGSKAFSLAMHTSRSPAGIQGDTSAQTQPASMDKLDELLYC